MMGVAINAGFGATTTVTTEGGGPLGCLRVLLGVGLASRLFLLVSLLAYTLTLYWCNSFLIRLFYKY
jgi:hypothetical protein